MTLGPLAFLNPWLLAGLAALPVIYWLLRTVPPRPREIVFPPARILAGIEAHERTPATTPWWLMILRLAAAAAIVLALAEPVLNPAPAAGLGGSGPAVIVVDNGWAAAPRWAERRQTVDRLIGEAEALNRPVLLLATASPAKTPSVHIEAPQAARATLAALQPQPFPPSRLAAAAALETALASAAVRDPAIVWVADGLDHGGEAEAFAARLARAAGNGPLTLVEDRGGTGPLGVLVPHGGQARLEAKVLRTGGPAHTAVLHAFSARGERLGEAAAVFAHGERSAVAAFGMPLELRNQVARIEIAGERSAGAVALLDARSRWQRVGLLSGESREQAQPLLAPLYYIAKALAPFAGLTEPASANLLAGIDTVLRQNVGVLMMADIGTLDGEMLKRVAAWVNNGGVLVRFAGPRLEKGGDSLLPVPLRTDGRSLGGALSWSTPQRLAPFDGESLFAGLDVPQDVTVNRQVLADPARMGADTQVWARLEDGTPLVTAARRGEGQVVLFHVTANSDWSNLPLSGLFVEMLRRITALGRTGAAAGTEGQTALAGGAAAASAAHLPPIETLDGFGVLKPPPPAAQPAPAAGFAGIRPSLDHPPGYYGTAGNPRALNVLAEGAALELLPPLPSAVQRRAAADDAAVPLGPWLLAAALALVLADIVGVLFLQWGGQWPRPARGTAIRPAAGFRAGAGALLLLAGLAALAAGSGEAGAEPRAASPARPGNTLAADDLALRATAKVTLAYVRTGDADTDEVSRLGLEGLNRMLSLRTAVEPGTPAGVNVATDEIVFYPVLYWPVLPDAEELDAAAVAKIDAYMKQGGMIIFDTRDYNLGMPPGYAQPGQSSVPLQRLLGRLDLPRLEPVPENHVLTKSFYLLRFFPGRWDGGLLWVEAGDADAPDHGHKARRSDGVTSILITSNDFAAAWALDERNRPLYPVVPGGERQRELAFRTGINIVMHALTGNYKADQVHVPALLERLGQ